MSSFYIHIFQPTGVEWVGRALVHTFYYELVMSCRKIKNKKLDEPSPQTSARHPLARNFLPGNSWANQMRTFVLQTDLDKDGFAPKNRLL